jgi:hypothetical protein
MYRMLNVKVDNLNSYLQCSLCKGYLIDAFTINECLHSCKYKLILHLYSTMKNSIFIFKQKKFARLV